MNCTMNNLSIYCSLLVIKKYIVNCLFLLVHSHSAMLTDTTLDLKQNVLINVENDMNKDF